MYLHTPAVEAGSWWRVDTASGSDTGTTVYAYDGTGAIPNYYVLTGSTVRNTSWDGTARFWSATQTLYLKELTYQGAPNGTVVTSTGTTPAAPVGGAPVDIATISTTVAALPSTYLTQASATTTYAARGLPSHAPSTALGLYDKARSVYNWKPSNTRRLRTALGKAQAGTANAHLWFIGDSETENYTGTTYDYLGMWPVVLRQTLASLGVPTSGDGYVKAYSGSALANIDSRWVTSGAGWSNAGSYMQCTTNGSTATFTSSLNCTNIDVFYVNTSGSWSFAVDGGSATVVTATGNSSILKVSYTGLAAGSTHTLVATNNAATSTQSFLVGVMAYKSSGVLVNNNAINGSKATDWTTKMTPYGYGYMQLGVKAYYNSSVIDGLFVALGVNDLLSSRTPAQVTADITTVLGSFPSTDVILVGQYQPSGVTLANWQAYISALYTLADTLDCPLIDAFDRSGGYTAANAAGLMGDTTHPNAAAQRDLGRLAGILAAI